MPFHSNAGIFPINILVRDVRLERNLSAHLAQEVLEIDFQVNI